MADEKDPLEPPQEPPQEPPAEPDPPAEPQQEPPADPEPKDKHGLPGINRDKYQRDIKERDDRIAELEARIAADAETKEGREKLEADLKALRDEMADKDMTHSLEMAGCVNVKAAKAVLADYGDNVSRLKSECPYLFDQKKQTGSVGGKPAGAPGGDEALVAKAREAAGTTRYYQK